jgi:hypothetical protein
MGFRFVDLPEEAFLREALDLVERARGSSVTLRLLGSLAVYAHSLDLPHCVTALRRLGRLSEGSPLFTDLDLAGYSRQRKQIIGLLEGLGFRPVGVLNALFGGRRLMYVHPRAAYHVDVFLDRLEFSHDVVFGEQPGRGRLDLDYPTIPLADIVLEKLQIHNINRKDLVDLAVLLMGHEVGDGMGKDVIDGRHVAKVLADDWGFWYDAKNNLQRLSSFVEQSEAEGKLGREEALAVSRRIEALLGMIDEEPKTSRWAKRAEVGTRKPWYREVEEVVR